MLRARLDPGNAARRVEACARIGEGRALTGEARARAIVHQPSRHAGAAPRASPAAARRRRAGWLSGIRFSGFLLIMMGVLVLAAVVLAPTIAAFAQQRQQIAELRAAVSQQEDEVQRLARRARALERRDVHHDPGARAAVLRDAGRGELPRRSTT